MNQPSVRDPDAFALLVADIFEAAGALRRDGEGIASSAGQTQARWQLLSVVAAGDWTVPMAADRLGTSRQAVQRIANELVDAASQLHRQSAAPPLAFLVLPMRACGCSMPSPARRSAATRRCSPSWTTLTSSSSARRCVS